MAMAQTCCQQTLHPTGISFTGAFFLLILDSTYTMVSTISTPSKTGTGDAPSDKARKAPASNNAQRKIPPSKPQPRDKRKGEMRLDKDDSGLTIDIPQKISGGNSLGPNQMLLIFVVFVGGLLHATYKMGSLFQPNGNKTYKRLTKSPVHRSEERRQLIRNSILDPLIKLMLQKDPNVFAPDSFEPCDLYLSPSSVPEFGWGFFAGKNYTLGESIRVEHRNLLLPPPSFHSGRASEVPVTKGISTWPLLLKPHSVLSNVKWEDSSTPLLVATREIAIGEEFFVSWEDHLSSRSSDESSPFDSIFAHALPSPEHFLRADDYIRGARTRYFGAINHTQLAVDAAKPKRKGNSMNSNGRWKQARGRTKKRPSQQLYKPESAKDIETGLTLWQSAVEIYDPLVAKLLPTKVGTLAMYHQRAIEDKSLFSSSSLLGSLQNRTVRSLANSATCVSSLEWHPVSETKDVSESQESCSSTSYYRQVVTREHGFSKGEIVGVVPLLAMQSSRLQITTSCLPLSSSSPSQEVVFCPLGGSIHQHSRDLDYANVEYRWSNYALSAIPLEVKSLFFTKSALESSLTLEEDVRQKEILLKVSNVIKSRVFGFR